MADSYFAYRLPNEDEIKYVKGQLVKKEKIHDLDESGLVFCSFDRSEIYQMNDPQMCSVSEFSFENCGEIGRSTTKEEYSEQFFILHEQLSRRRFEKVVLSRRKRIKHHKKDLVNLYQQLNKSYSNTFNYLLSSPEIGCWMGASPELLCSVQNEKVRTVSLAGTKTKDQEWTNKEIQEQLYVTNYIEQKMTDIACINLKSDGPKSISSGPVEHLKTIITCNLKDEKNWRDVIDALHPTPATCGSPLNASMNFIKRTEQHPRKFYTGFIGLFKNGNKNCFVNLRCMELNKKAALIYVGGGLTAASELENEWQETERKAKTLETILQD